MYCTLCTQQSIKKRKTNAKNSNKKCKRNKKKIKPKRAEGDKEKQ